MPFDLPRMSSHIRTSGHLFIRQSSVLSLPTMLGPIHHTLPPETLVAIMSYVCTDGGRMGHSLNLVCKAFRQLCVDSAVDIQIISLRGSRQLKGFLEVLSGRAETKRKVVSLLMSDRDGQSSPMGEVLQQSCFTISLLSIV